MFGTKKLEWCGLPTMKMLDDMYSRFDTIPACDGQTERHLAIYTHRAVASRQ